MSGVRIIAPFELKSGVPLDTRLVVENLSDLPDVLQYDGMMVYQRSNKKFYKKEDGIFKTLSEAAGVSAFNDATGPIYVVGGTGINFRELDVGSGVFEISVAGVIMEDGSTDMALGYTPQRPRSLITKEYLEEHANTIASTQVAGHVKIDDETIKQNLQQKIYVNTVNGGEF